MHTSTAVFFTTLATASLAAQPPYPGAGRSVNYLSTFDDLDALPLVALPALQELTGSSVGPYNGLDMQLALLTLGVNGAIPLGVVPPSKPNGAAYNAQIQRPLITTHYPGSAANTFDFHSLYAGCVANTPESALSAVTRCNILVQGYRATKLVAQQELSFDFGAVALRASMKKYHLHNFTNLDTVTFTSDYALRDLLGATVLDDLSYTVHY